MKVNFDRSGNDPVPAGTLWRIRLAAILWFVLIIGCLLALPVMVDATVLIVLAALVLALLFAALAVWVWRLVFRRNGRGHFLFAWLKTSFATFCVLCILTAAPLYYFAVKTAADPALLPTVTLSNGSKTVMLQGMMHIGTEGFYKSVVYDAERALSDGYVLYYEGVQPNPEGDKWFADKLAGGGDLSGNYKALGEICGLHFQLDYFDLLARDMKSHPERHVTADVDTLDMKREYERLMRTDRTFAAEMKAQEKAEADEGGGTMATIGWLKQGTDGQRKLAGIFCRYLLNGIGRPKPPTQMEKVILEFRNRKLVERILREPSQRIYVTYGSAHIKGVVALMQAADPRWTIESVRWMRPIETPQKLEGTL